MAGQTPVADGEIITHALAGPLVEAGRYQVSWNGEDDNGNGIADEPGFLITRDGTRLDVWLTVGRMDARGQLVERTLNTAMKLRNGL